MNQPTPQPQTPPRERIGAVPQVDVTDAAAAGELVLTIHVKTGQDQSHNPGAARATRPAGFRRAIAGAVQAVVDDLMPFPEAPVAATAEPAVETVPAVLASEIEEA
jgi:hypothetical protein